MMTSEVKQHQQREHGVVWRVLRWAVHCVAALVGVLLRVLGGADATECAVRRVTVAVRGRRRPCARARLVFLSDLHASARPRCPRALLAAACRAALAAAPDAVVLGGDYVDAPADAPLLATAVAAELLAPLAAARVPVLAALGNHDQAPRAHRARTAAVLARARLRVVGCGDCTTPGDFAPARVCARAAHAPACTAPACLSTPLAPPGAPFASATITVNSSNDNNGESGDGDGDDGDGDDGDTVVVAVTHNPDAAEELLRAWRCDVVLAGHTHGTQVWAPRVGPVLPWLKRAAPRWLQPAVRLLHGSDVRHWEWAAGLHRLACPCGARTALLYVSCGLGSHPPGRIACPPEVTIIDFVSDTTT